MTKENTEFINALNKIQESINELQEKGQKSILDFFESSENTTPLEISLATATEHILKEFKKSDIIPSNLAKSYALISSSSNVLQDLCNEMIEKANHKKGRVKLMYLHMFQLVMKAIGLYNSDKLIDSNESRFSLFRKRKLKF